MDKSLLTAKRNKTEELEIPGIGTVTLRAITRSEAFRFVGKTMPEEKMEAIVLSLALVDPQMTEAEVAEWQSVASAGELQAVVEKALQISGLAEDSAKSAYKSAGE